MKEALLIYPLRRLMYENLIVCNGPLWFLLTLFMVINIGNILLKKLNPLSIALLGTIIGYLINLTHNESIPDIIDRKSTRLNSSHT